eukprot:symbB.v1.2.018486.t1/scaffold1464.1/size117165/9
MPRFDANAVNKSKPGLASKGKGHSKGTAKAQGTPRSGHGAAPSRLSGPIGFTVRFVQGVWQVVKSAGGHELDCANLPDIEANGCGFWTVIDQDGTQFVWQGGETEGIDASEFFTDDPMAGIPLGLDDPDDDEEEAEVEVEADLLNLTDPPEMPEETPTLGQQSPRTVQKQRTTPFVEMPTPDQVPPIPPARGSQEEEEEEEPREAEATEAEARIKPRENCAQRCTVTAIAHAAGFRRPSGDHALDEFALDMDIDFGEETRSLSDFMVSAEKHKELCQSPLSELKLPPVEDRFMLKIATLDSYGVNSRCAVDDGHGDEQAERADQRGPASEEPLTRKAFNLLRESYDSTHSMVESFLQDHANHMRLRILVECGRPLQAEYKNALDEHKAGQFNMITWQARRSAGAWYKNTVNELLKLLDSEAVLKKLDLRLPSGSNFTPGSLDDQLAQSETARCKQFATFIFELCKARCWSQLHHSLNLPHAFARVFVPSGTERETARVFFKKMAKVLKAVIAMQQENLKKEKPSAKINEFVADLGTLDWTLTREILADGESVDWDVTYDNLRKLAWAMFASSAETKDSCENCFGWLSDSCARQTKTDKMADMTKFLYLAICPYPRQGGNNMVVPTSKDIKFLTADEKKMFSSLKLFDHVATKLPFEEVTQEKIKGWRPAGFRSQRVAAGAMATALMAVNKDTGVFDQSVLDDLWASCLLLDGKVYFNRSSGVYNLCLGYFKYVALGIKLVEHLQGDRVYLKVDYERTVPLPTFMFNRDPSPESIWSFVPCSVVPPIASFGNCVCFVRDGSENLPLLPSALLHGVWMTKPQIESCLISSKIVFPEPDASGRVLKKHLVETLVSAVLPDITAEKREAIIKSLCRETNPHDDEKAEDCPSEILEVIKNMDAENRQHWKNVVEHAAKMLEKRMSEEVEKQVREKYQKLARPSDPEKIATDKPPAAPRNTGPHKNPALTKARAPPQFTSLLPAVPYLYLYWWPDKKTVQAQFKGGIEAGDQKSKSARWLDESMKEKSWALKSVLTFVSFTCERMKPRVEYSVPSQEEMEKAISDFEGKK